jgi:succinate dehydrogenase / fumarate reductase membrane anchor subunit
MTSEIEAAAASGSAAPTREAPAAGTMAAARPTGSAREGAEHWLQERMSSLAVFLLWLWFAVSLLRLPSHDHAMIAEWLSSPLAAVPMLLLVAATFWHLRLGLQVVIDDYVHEQGSKMVATTLLAFAAILGAAFAIFFVLKLALAGAP